MLTLDFTAVTAQRWAVEKPLCEAAAPRTTSFRLKLVVTFNPLRVLEAT